MPETSLQASKKYSIIETAMARRYFEMDRDTDLGNLLEALRPLLYDKLFQFQELDGPTPGNGPFSDWCGYLISPTRASLAGAVMQPVIFENALHFAKGAPWIDDFTLSFYDHPTAYQDDDELGSIANYVRMEFWSKSKVLMDLARPLLEAADLDLREVFRERDGTEVTG